MIRCVRGGSSRGTVVCLRGGMQWNVAACGGSCNHTVNAAANIAAQQWRGETPVYLQRLVASTAASIDGGGAMMPVTDGEG